MRGKVPLYTNTSSCALSRLSKIDVDYFRIQPAKSLGRFTIIQHHASPSSDKMQKGMLSYDTIVRYVCLLWTTLVVHGRAWYR